MSVVPTQNASTISSPTGSSQYPPENTPQEHILAPSTYNGQLDKQAASLAKQEFTVTTTPAHVNPHSRYFGEQLPSWGGYDTLEDYSVFKFNPIDEVENDQSNRIAAQITDASSLTAYNPSVRNHFLKDPRISAAFWHFINVTGPNLSLYDRDPSEYSRLWEHDLPRAAIRSVWTCMGTRSVSFHSLR